MRDIRMGTVKPKECRMMRRLIDADDLIKHLTDWRLQECPVGICDEETETYKTICECIEAVKAQPTAYDTERVIEQLNDLPTFKVSATSEKHPFCAYESEMISKHKVMGIVKKGGVE